MKKQERYKLLNHTKKEYSEIFKCNYQFKKLSKKALYKLLQQNKHSHMCEWSYCCYGLYRNCWQEPYLVGNWGLTQEQINEIIKSTIDKTAKICRKDNRILYFKDEYSTHIIIVARDVMKDDYLFTFTNKEDC